MDVLQMETEDLRAAQRDIQSELNYRQQLGLGRIPSSVIAPIVQEYLDKYETCDIQEPFDALADPKSGAGGSFSMSEYRAPNPLYILAHDAEMKANTLSRILRIKQRTVSFWDVDRLLNAMGRPDLWRCEPLLAYYEAEEVA